MFASSFKKMLLKSMSRKFHGNSLKASATRQKIVIFQDSVMAADSSSWIQAREIAFFLIFPKHVHVDWKSWGTMKSSISFISLSFHFMYLTHFIQVIFLKSWRKKDSFFYRMVPPLETNCITKLSHNENEIFPFLWLSIEWISVL